MEAEQVICGLNGSKIISGSGKIFLEGVEEGREKNTIDLPIFHAEILFRELYTIFLCQFPQDLTNIQLISEYYYLPDAYSGFSWL